MPRKLLPQAGMRNRLWIYVPTIIVAASVTIGAFAASGWIGREPANEAANDRNLIVSPFASRPFRLSKEFLLENSRQSSVENETAFVTISGRVATPDGLPVRFITITLTDPDNTVRRTLSSPFGYYRFTGVDASKSYVLSASGKRHVMLPLNLSDLAGDVQGANLLAYPSVNVALELNGGIAKASSQLSSSYPAASAIDGDRKGLNWGAGGGWNDATVNEYPDRLQVDFDGSRVIDTISVFTVQDDLANPSEPTDADTFSSYGITDFDVQFWNGTTWATVENGNISGNNKVWRKLTFAAVETSKVRVLVNNALAGHSRITEVEVRGSRVSPPPTPSPTPTPTPEPTPTPTPSPTPPATPTPTPTPSDSPRLVADYHFSGDLNSSVAGAPALLNLTGSGPNTFVADLVDGYIRQTLRFQYNGGVALFDTSTVVPNNTYTIVGLFRLEDVSGFRRIIDFKNGASQSGAYILNGRFEAESTANTPLQPGLYVQAVIVREPTGRMRAYRDGRLMVNIADDGGVNEIDSSNVLRFFQDDFVTGGQASAGNAVRLRIYDGPMTSLQVRALDRLPNAVGGGSQPILFTSGRNGNPDVYTMDADGSKQVRLTHDHASDLAPSWSPDGTKILFSSSRDGNLEVYSMNADGSNQMRLTNNPDMTDYYAQWSPDGGRILYSQCISVEPFICEIWVMNSDGSNQINLTNNPDSDDDHARWSPDGTKIVFMSERHGVATPGANPEIYVMNADGSNPVRLTFNSLPDLNPVFSPDGSKIAFSSERDGGNGEIYVMNADGSSQTNLTNSFGYDYLPAWSPDGAKIAFSSVIANGMWEEIMVMNFNGSGQSRITFNNTYDLMYGWRGNQ